MVVVLSRSRSRIILRRDIAEGGGCCVRGPLKKTEAAAGAAGRSAPIEASTSSWRCESTTQSVVQCFVSMLPVPEAGPPVRIIQHSKVLFLHLRLFVLLLLCYKNTSLRMRKYKLFFSFFPIYLYTAV